MQLDSVQLSGEKKVLGKVEDMQISLYLSSLFLPSPTLLSFNFAHGSFSSPLL